MTHQFDIPIDQSELDLDRTLKSGQTFRWRKDEQGTWHGSDGPVWWSFRQNGQSISVVSNETSEAATRYLGLAHKFADFARFVETNGPELVPFLAGMPGLRILQPRDPLETTLTFLCSGNNSLHRIIPMANHLGRYGERLENGSHQFPTIDQLENLTETELREKGFGYRAKFIVQSIQIIQSNGDNWFKNLKYASYQDAWKELTTLPGVGRKIADCICLFGLGHRQAVPIDTHIWQQLTRLYHPELVGENLTATRYEYAANAFRNRFGGHAGWAHQFLFEENVANGRARRKAASALPLR